MNWIRNNALAISLSLMVVGITCFIVCVILAITETCDKVKSNAKPASILPKNELAFCAEGGPNGWVMKINDYGIFFNRERFPLATQDDFAVGVINILENQYTVKFERR